MPQKQGASVINIYSPDTDVLVLALHRYPELCTNTNFVTGTGSKRCSISLKSIHDVLGLRKATALTGLHCISGADNTGSFARRAKISFWKAFWNADDHSDDICALENLGMICILDLKS